MHFSSRVECGDVSGLNKVSPLVASTSTKTDLLSAQDHLLPLGLMVVHILCLVEQL